jgi:hypothetical protein
MSKIRKRLALVVAIAAAAVVFPMAAVGATSLFDDVPDDSIFVNDINWMKVNGVTALPRAVTRRSTPTIALEAT